MKIKPFLLKKAISFALSFCMFLSAVGVVPAGQMDTHHNHSIAVASGCQHENTQIDFDEAYHFTICSDCGEEISREGHSSDICFNETQHWEDCTVCDYVSEKSEHLAQSGSNCIGTFCAYCDDYFGVVDEDNHADAYLKSNDTMHWIVCDACDYSGVDDAVPHNFTSVTFCQGSFCVDCNDCFGSADPDNHLFAVKCDDEYHWFECILCGQEEPKEAHNDLGGEVCAGTLCSVCLSVYGEGDGVSHVWDEYITNDENSHWYNCLYCDEKNNEAEHNIYIVEHFTDESFHYFRCTDCNLFVTAAHDWTQEKEHDETYHWDECSTCNYVSEKKHHSQGEVSCEGVFCSHCNDYFGESVDHEWDYEEILATLEHHWYKCKNCEAMTDEEEHIPGDNSTCSVYICSVCSHPYGEGDGVSHNYDYGSLEGVEEGHGYKCTRCGHIEELFDHNAYEINCQGTYCDECGTYYGTVKTDHEFSYDQYYYDESGHWFECIYCNERTGQSVHDSGIANCSFTACSECGYAVGIGDGVSHVYDMENLVGDENSHWFECRYCEAKTGEESHSPDVDYCYGSICSDCGYNFGVTDPDAHIWDTHNYFCDDQNHWIECENCDARRDEAQHVASDTITCSGVLCTICNLPYGDGEGDHKPSESYFYSDDQTHWKYCEYCSECIEQGAHEAGDVVCRGVRCTICEDIYGEGDGVSHEFTYYNYYSDENSHWFECRYCDERQMQEDHVPSGIFNCAGEICAVCREVIRYQPSDNHEIYCIDGNEQGHIQWCPNCDYESERLPHEFRNLAHCDGLECWQCGYVDDTVQRGEHVIGSYEGDDTHHWNECYNCDEKFYITEHFSDQTLYCQGMLCDGCGEYYGSETDKNNHIWELYSNHVAHWEECIGCGVTRNYENHDDNGELYCTGRECSVCQEIHGNAVDLDNHIFDCRGQTDGHCIVCELCGYIEGEIEPHSSSQDELHCAGARCDECGWEIGGDIDLDNHLQMKKLRYDTTTHWSECKHCYTRENVTEHNYVKNADGTTSCKDCEFLTYTVIGDVDGSDTLTLRDIVALYQSVSKWDVEIDENAADVNGDGDVNIRDTVLLYQFFSGWDVGTEVKA